MVGILIAPIAIIMIITMMMMKLLRDGWSDNEKTLQRSQGWSTPWRAAFGSWQPESFDLPGAFVWFYVHFSIDQHAIVYKFHIIRFCTPAHFCGWILIQKLVAELITLPKAQRTRGLSSSWSCQSHIASSITILERISSSESLLSIN